jgi:hypothetical protein
MIKRELAVKYGAHRIAYADGSGYVFADATQKISLSIAPAMGAVLVTYEPIEPNL